MTNRLQTHNRSLRFRIAQLIRARHRSRGQVIVILAFAMVALIGMLGLATDLGYVFVERRTLQNASDAAALAGAQQLTKWDSTNKTYSNGLSVLGAVQGVVSGNEVGGKAPTILSCTYVDSSANMLGQCSSSTTTAPPAAASGVQVVVSETHSTFFIRIVGIKTATTSTESAAQDYKVTVVPNGAPFIVCGFENTAGAPSGATLASGKTTIPAYSDAVLHLNGNSSGYSVALVKKDPTPTPVPTPTSTATGTATVTPTATATATGGGQPNILNADDTINVAAIGQTYEIHGPQINTCGAGSNSFKGLAGSNDAATIPGLWTIDTGVKAGPTRALVSGIGGCQNNAQDPYDCIMVLPVADSATGNGSNTMMHVVNIAAFYVSSCGANCHSGELIGQFTVGTGGSPLTLVGPWKVGDDGVLITRIVK